MAQYLRYVIKNLEPVRIADGSTSQRGQTNTLRFIPGSAVRGYVVNAFARNDPDLAETGEILFSNRIAFLNAILASDTHTLLPSPKGFYEDKSLADDKKRIANVVVDGSFDEGFKRASLGRYCYIDGDCIHYYGVRTGSDMRITVNSKDNKRSVFRNEYIEEGQYFEGHIRLSGESQVDDVIKALFEEKKKIVLGNARSSGMGTCQVVTSEVTDSIPYADEVPALQDEAYLMLLSDTVLRGANGELCGMDPGKKEFCDLMETMLGVTELTIPFASTSTRRIQGYNRKWGTAVPSVLAYEAGSVFHLKFKGTIDREHAAKLYNDGIGIRKNEGFGRVLFLKDYDRVQYKIAESDPWKNRARTGTVSQYKDYEKKTIETVALGLYKNALDDAMEYYVNHNSFSRNDLSSSQLGTLEARIMCSRYAPEKMLGEVDKYFDHLEKKSNNQRVQNTRASGVELHAQIRKMLTDPLEETLFSGQKKWPFREKGKVMGLPVDDFFGEKKEAQYKMKLLVRMIRFDHKKEANENG